MIVYHWWNRSWGSMTRRDVWVEQLPDRRWLIRWHGGGWRDRDGRYVTSNWRVAVAVLQSLLVDTEPWREISGAGRPRPW